MGYSILITPTEGDRVMTDNDKTVLVKVDWDLEGKTAEEAGVEEIVEVPDGIEDVPEWLSDNYGWCVSGWCEVEVTK